MINGKPFSYYGLVPLKFNGFLDMPSRLGEIYHDWGDVIEPLVHSDDLFWRSRNLSIDFIYDDRITDLNFKQGVNEISGIIGHFDLVTPFASNTVKLLEVKKVNHPNDTKVIYAFSFIEKEMQFVEQLPIANGGNGILIDEYDLKNDFGIIVSKVKFNDDVPELIGSDKTVFSPQKPFTDFRTFKTIELNCSKIKSENYISEVYNFQKLLSDQGFRYVTYKGVVYKAFLSEGFKVEINKGAIHFKIKLNVSSQEHLFQNDLFESGLFYTGNQRKYKESLFEYSLFGIGIFQQ